MAHALTRSSGAETRMNLATLKRVDPYVKSIMCQSKHVFLYFHREGKWEKGDTEGPLFVFERVCEPKYGFIILNRLNQKNLIEPIHQELEFQSQPPFMLYKTKDDEIRGIWFYKEEECVMVSGRVQELLKETSQTVRQRVQELPPASQQPKDLASLLSQASSRGTPTKGRPAATQAKPGPARAPQESEENKLLRLLTGGPPPKASRSPAPPKTAGLGGPPPEGNVAAFFAQANQSAFCPPMMGGDTRGGPPPMISAPRAGPPPIMGGDPRGGPPSMMGMPMMPAQAPETGPPEPDHTQDLLQRLMANPGVHSLEALERTQRQTSPRPPGGTMPPLPADAIKADDFESSLASMKVSSGAGVSYAVALSGSTPPGPLNGLVAAIKTEPEMKLISPFDLAKAKPNLEPSRIRESHVLSNPMNLIKQEPIETEDLQTRNGSSTRFPNGHAEDRRAHVTPLTKEQLLEAFHHLLNVDPTFIGKLHQAYVESLNTKLF